MARTSDPDSATAQFFINVVDNGFLDRPGRDGVGYCVFGKVIEGMDVVDKIKAVKTAQQGRPRRRAGRRRGHPRFRFAGPRSEFAIRTPAQDRSIVPARKLVT